MRLKVLWFHFHVKHRSGKQNSTNCISCHLLPFSKVSKKEVKIAEDLQAFVHNIIFTDFPTAVSVEELSQPVKLITFYQGLNIFCRTTNQPQIKAKWGLTFQYGVNSPLKNDIALRGDRIIIPGALRKKSSKCDTWRSHGISKT